MQLNIILIMAQYINKDALVAEIESEIKKLHSNLEICKTENDSKTMNLFIGCFSRVLSLIDTQEVKEISNEDECIIVPKPVDCYSTCKECPWSTNNIKKQRGE